MGLFPNTSASSSSYQTTELHTLSAIIRNTGHVPISLSLRDLVLNHHENENNKQEKFDQSSIVASNSEGNAYVRQLFCYASINFY